MTSRSSARALSLVALLIPALLRAQERPRTMRISAHVGFLANLAGFTPRNPYLLPRDRLSEHGFGGGSTMVLRIGVPAGPPSLRLELAGSLTDRMSIETDGPAWSTLMPGASVAVSDVSLSARVTPEWACVGSVCANVAVGGGLRAYDIDADQDFGDYTSPFSGDQTVPTLALAAGVIVPVGRMRLDIDIVGTSARMRGSAARSHDVQLLLGIGFEPTPRR